MYSWNLGTFALLLKISRVTDWFLVWYTYNIFEFIYNVFMKCWNDLGCVWNVVINLSRMDLLLVNTLLSDSRHTQKSKIAFKLKKSFFRWFFLIKVKIYSTKTKYTWLHEIKLKSMNLFDFKKFKSKKLFFNRITQRSNFINSN